MRGIFVTGTDTEAGKTVVSSVLAAALRRFGRIAYWKPVQTGIEQDDDTAEVRRLASCAADEIADIGIRLPRPLSPHLSARLAGEEFAIRDLTRIAEGLDRDRTWIVEGAGGLLVPLNGSETVADLMAALGLPAVVAARSGLGTINHTLLTLAEMRRRAIAIGGVVMVGEPNAENRIAIENYGQVAVLAELPVLSPLGPETVGRAAAKLADSLRGLWLQASSAGRA